VHPLVLRDLCFVQQGACRSLPEHYPAVLSAWREQLRVVPAEGKAARGCLCGRARGKMSRAKCVVHLRKAYVLQGILCERNRRTSGHDGGKGSLEILLASNQEDACLNAHRRSKCLVKDAQEAGRGIRYDLVSFACHLQDRARTAIGRNDRDAVPAGQRIARKLARGKLTPSTME
jgi:hypothetical protein